MKGGGIFPGCLCLIVGDNIDAGKTCIAKEFFPCHELFDLDMTSLGVVPHWSVDLPGAVWMPGILCIQTKHLRPLQPPPGTDVSDERKPAKEAA